MFWKSKSKMRILHIAECAGGVDRYLEMLLPLLADRYEQIFVCSQNYDVHKYEQLVDRVEQLVMKQTLLPWTIIRQVRLLRNIIKENHPDIVYCHSSFAGGLGRLSCIGLSCKVVYNPHGWAYNMN